MHFLFLLVCPFAMDLAFLLDASGSIGSVNYEQVKAFIIKLIEYFQVSSAGKKVVLEKSLRSSVCSLFLSLSLIRHLHREYFKRGYGQENSVSTCSLIIFTGTHVGVVSFSSSAKTEILFSAEQNVKAIKASILNITYYTGSTRIDLGLQKCRKELFTAGGGMRSNVPQVLLVITDGKSTGKSMHEFFNLFLI